MALLIQPNGKRTNVTPKGREGFSLEELQAFVGGYIETYTISSGVAVFDEDGLSKRLPMNEYASVLAGIQLVGPVLICSQQELEATSMQRINWRKVFAFEAEDEPTEPTTTERVVHYPANHPSSQVQRLVKRDIGAALKDTGVNLVSLRGPMHSGGETTWIATLTGPEDVLGMMPESIFVFTGEK